MLLPRIHERTPARIWRECARKRAFIYSIAFFPSKRKNKEQLKRNRSALHLLVGVPGTRNTRRLPNENSEWKCLRKQAFRAYFTRNFQKL